MTPRSAIRSLKLFRDVLDWFYVTPDGNEEGTFFNPNLDPLFTYSQLRRSTIGTACSRPRKWAASKTA